MTRLILILLFSYSVALGDGIVLQAASDQRADYYSGRESIAIEGDVYVIKELIIPPKVIEVTNAFYTHTVSLYNTSNPLYSISWPTNRKTGKRVAPGWLAGMEIDSTLFSDVINDIFPHNQGCSIRDGQSFNDKVIGKMRVFVKADPQTGQILYVVVRLYCSSQDKRMLLIPPEKIRQLEQAVYTRCKCFLPLPREVYRDDYINASYLPGGASVGFSKEDLEQLIEPQ